MVILQLLLSLTNSSKTKKSTREKGFARRGVGMVPGQLPSHTERVEGNENE